MYAIDDLVFGNIEIFNILLDKILKYKTCINDRTYTFCKRENAV